MTLNREKIIRFRELLVSAFLYILPFVVVFSAILTIVIEEERVWKGELRRELQTHIYEESIRIEDYLDEVVQDISFLADTAEALENSGDSRGRIYSELTDVFVRFGQACGSYAQLRLLDTKGREVVRVDFKDGEAIVYPRDELQDKSHRYYFTDTIGLHKGHISVSRMDLNIENKEIEIPYNPMVRFATVIFDKSDKKRGVLVLNYKASDLLDIVGVHSEGFESNINSQLLNQDGHWLYNPEREKCWGFMFDDKQNVSMAVEDPQLWEKINESTSGIFENERGIFVYSTIYQLRLASERLGFAPVFSTEIQSNQPFWKFVSYLPRDYLAANKERTNVELLFVLAIVGAVIALIENKLIMGHKQLKQRQESLETIFEIVPVGMLLLNERTEVVKANGFIKKLIGEPRLGEQPGNSLRCVHSLEDPKGCGHSPSCPQCPIRNAIADALQGNKSVHRAEVLSTLLIDGKETDVWLEVSAEPFSLEGKRHSIVVINDISEIKRAQEQLKQISERKSTFVANVSHEFKNPLGIIKESLSLILDGAAGDISAKQKEILEMGKRNIERLIRLVTNLLDVSKIEAGKMELKTGEVEIGPLVDEVAANNSGEISKKQLTFEKDVPPDIGSIWADKDRITEVVINLLSNAIKYTPSGGKIAIKLTGLENEIRFEISDTGPGFTKEDMGKLFDKFERIKAEKQEGTGLGLCIAKDIVDLHKGRMWVESEPGKGSSFIFTLPRDIRSQSDVSRQYEAAAT